MQNSEHYTTDRSLRINKKKMYSVIGDGVSFSMDIIV